MRKRAIAAQALQPCDTVETPVAAVPAPPLAFALQRLGWQAILRDKTANDQAPLADLPLLPAIR